MADDILVGSRQFKFELVAPEKVEISSHEERVLLPGEMGDFMVLAGHELLLAGLRPGVVAVIQNNGSTQRYFITGGLADVGNTHCIVLTPHITPVEKLNAGILENEITRTETALGTATDKHDQEHLQTELNLLRLKHEAAVKYAA